MERRSDCGLLIRWNRGLSLPFTQTKHYRLNILDFPHYKVIGDRVVPSDGRTNPCWFADLRYTYAAPLPHKYYESIAEVVLPSPIVGHAIATTSAICGQSFSKVSKRAKCLLDEIKAKFSRFICKICGYLLFKIFRRLMNSIFVSPHQMQRLQAAAQTSTPILYLPLHRSHLDYLLITFTLWHWGLQLPHIASGSNLNLSGFGWLLRATGAFFIRRRIDGDGRPPNLDLLYRSVLEAYMIEILRARMPLEFFLEGTRSRFGKPLPPKNGLLSNVVKAVLQGTLKDVWIVPVSFTYDSVVEGIFENELMGVSRQKESVWKVMRHVISDFKRGKCGCVYIDFGQPTLLSVR
ncbi:unnamed protein product [Dracunculus medinensis]|uniref:PlsC domain-containing protein n=1 Tax=Dracunculus medinensis TaxID=318479 RepID=A0A0N4UPQ7_DRAME|nr:unnamed protein product [Dracunculus medinensis]